MDNPALNWRLDYIKRGLMLVRTSNNAHSHTNVEVLTEKVDSLPFAAKRELALTLVNIAKGLWPDVLTPFFEGDDIGGHSMHTAPVDGSEIELLVTGKEDSQVRWYTDCFFLRDEWCHKSAGSDLTIVETELGKPTAWRHLRPSAEKNLTWHYVSAEEQNPNSHKLEGWFPSRALADRHRESWPAFISRSMKVYPLGMAPVSINGEKLAPEHLQNGVAAELYAALKKHGLQPSKFMNGTAIKDAEAVVEKTPPICETQSAAEDDLSGAVTVGLPVAVRYIIQEYKLLRGPMLKVVSKDWLHVPGSPSFSDPVDADAHLEKLERADLDGDHAYRVKLIK